MSARGRRETGHVQALVVPELVEGVDGREEFGGFPVVEAPVRLVVQAAIESGDGDQVLRHALGVVGACSASDLLDLMRDMSKRGVE